jgi:hypothetical protein
MSEDAQIPDEELGRLYFQERAFFQGEPSPRENTFFPKSFV